MDLMLLHESNVYLFSSPTHNPATYGGYNRSVSENWEVINPAPAGSPGTDRAIENRTDDTGQKEEPVEALDILQERSELVDPPPLSQQSRGTAVPSSDKVAGQNAGGAGLPVVPGFTAYYGGYGGGPFGSLAGVAAQGGVIDVGMLPGCGGRITSVMLNGY
jgi:hypothetical protein